MSYNKMFNLIESESVRSQLYPKLFYTFAETSNCYVKNRKTSGIW